MTDLFSFAWSNILWILIWMAKEQIWNVFLFPSFCCPILNVSSSKQHLCSKNNFIARGQEKKKHFFNTTTHSDVPYIYTIFRKIHFGLPFLNCHPVGQVSSLSPFFKLIGYGECLTYLRKLTINVINANFKNWR